MVDDCTGKNQIGISTVNVGKSHFQVSVKLHSVSNKGKDRLLILLERRISTTSEYQYVIDVDGSKSYPIL